MSNSVGTLPFTGCFDESFVEFSEGRSGNISIENRGGGRIVAEDSIELQLLQLSGNYY